MRARVPESPDAACRPEELDRLLAVSEELRATSALLIGEMRLLLEVNNALCERRRLRALRRR